MNEKQIKNEKTATINLILGLDNKIELQTTEDYIPTEVVNKIISEVQKALTKTGTTTDFAKQIIKEKLIDKLKLWRTTAITFIIIAIILWLKVKGVF